MSQISTWVSNQGGAPAILENTIANRPTFGIVGRLFVSTDTFTIYRDTGISWVIIGSSAGGTITGSGVINEVALWNGTSSITGDNELYYDSTNNYFGIGTNTPGTNLDVHGTNNVLVQLNSTTTGNSLVSLQNQGTAKWRIGNNYNAGNNDFIITDVLILLIEFH